MMGIWEEKETRSFNTFTSYKQSNPTSLPLTLDVNLYESSTFCEEKIRGGIGM